MIATPQTKNRFFPISIKISKFILELTNNFELWGPMNYAIQLTILSYMIVQPNILKSKIIKFTNE